MSEVIVEPVANNQTVRTLKERIVSLIEAGATPKEISDTVKCSPAFVYTVRKQVFPELTRSYKTSGKRKKKAKSRVGKVISSTPFVRPEGRPIAFFSSGETHEEWLRRIAKQNPPAVHIPPPILKDVDAMQKSTDKFFEDELVNHPAHYTAGGIETYDFIVAKQLSYELGNVVKYITRAEYKGNKLQDLRKARWYLDAAIKRESP